MLKRIVVLAALLTLALGALGVQAQDQTIAAIAAGDANFSTLVTLVEAAGLTDVLNGEGPYTVFAPTNDAFAALPPAAVAYLTDPANVEALTRVLTYHVVGDAVMSADITSMMAPSMEMSAVGEEPTGSQLDVVVSDMGEIGRAHV